MKQQYIHTTIDATGAAISLGRYWDCSGRQPVATAWEYLGDEQGIMLALDTLREEHDAEFMHVVNRVIVGGTTNDAAILYS